MSIIDKTIKAQIFEVLVEECGCREDLWADFDYHFPKCREFRFQGGLGFGGKVWHDLRVTCYREDETPARREMLNRANERLSQLGGGQ